MSIKNLFSGRIGRQHFIVGHMALLMFGPVLFILLYLPILSFVSGILFYFLPIIYAGYSFSLFVRRSRDIRQPIWLATIIPILIFASISKDAFLFTNSLTFSDFNVLLGSILKLSIIPSLILIAVPFSIIKSKVSGLV